MDTKAAFGASAGILAVVALVLHIAVPKTGTPPAASTVARTGAIADKAGSAPTGTSEGGTAQPPKIEGPWLAAQTFFHEEPEGIECPAPTGGSASLPVVGCASTADFTHLSEIESCANDSGCSERLARFFGVANNSGQKPLIQYVLATIPDPLHTRLALSTDSSIEAIEKAAFDSHWEFAAQWLPWYDGADLSEKDPEKRKSQRALVKEQESQPGLLIFRHAPVSDGATRSKSSGYRFDENVLFVFVIGETPTAGINGVSFRIARAYMRAFGGGREVRVAGPSFSGSYYSLSQLIEADQLRDEQREASEASSDLKYYVRNGTASSSDAADALKRTRCVHTGCIDLRSTGENSTDHARNLKRVLDYLRIQPSQAAILSEDDTAFSQQLRYTDRSDRTLVLRFPRDISHLRNVYRDVNQNADGQNAASSVELSLKDAESGEDTVPIFSAAQTPAAQNAVLENIINDIRGSQVRLVELAATNVLDALFLAEVLRQQCPDTRLLVDQPDLLFVKAAQTAPLGGLLAISSYPLFPASRHWSLDSTGTEHPVHENSGAEALYNAVASLLLPPDQQSRLNDYAWDGGRWPRSWLLELSRRGFSPVELLQNREASWYFEDPSSSKASFRLAIPSKLWLLLTSIFAAVSLGLCAWITYLHGNKFELTWSVAATDGRHIADAYRLMILFFALLILAVGQAILYIPLLVAGAPIDLGELRGEYVFHLLSIAGIAVPFGFAVWLLKPIFAKPRLTAMRYAYAAFGLAFAFLIPALWYIACSRAEGHAGFFFAMRAVEMNAGTSPSLPILLLLAALFLFSSCHLVRFYFAISHRPRMFTAAVDRFSKGKLRSCRRAMNRVLVWPMGMRPRQQVNLALAIAGALVFADLVMGAQAKLSSTEGRWFDAVTFILISFVTAAIALTTIQIKECWAALQQVLVRLRVLPLVCGFTQSRDPGQKVPIWARRFDLQSLDLPTKSVVILHNLGLAITNRSLLFPELCPNQISTWYTDYRDTLSNLIAGTIPNKEGTTAGRHDIKMDRAAVRKEFGHLRYLGATISHTLNERLVVPAWIKSQLPLMPNLPDKKAKSGNDCGDSTEQLPSELAETFVVFQYSMFISYGVRQIQNLLLSVSLGYALLVLALNVYSLEAARSINRFLLVCFVVISVVIWRVMSQMERDPILSRLSGTKEGELNREFYVKIIGYGALPIVTLLGSQFPAIGHFLTSWVEPSLEAFK
ncbi:MAG: hypothetical protein WA324_23770 [Bryobacteraceae bacterium]